MHFIHDSVYIRHNACDNKQTGFLHQILPFILRQMLFMDILLLFQPFPFIAQRNKSQSILQCPRNVRCNDPHQCFIIFLHFVLRIQVHLAQRLFPARNIQDKTCTNPLSRHLIPLSIFSHNTEVRRSHQRKDILFHRGNYRFCHILYLPRINGYGSRYLTAYFQSTFQLINIKSIPHTPSFIQYPK